MIKKWRASISAHMILVLILALAVGVGCYFGCYRLGVWTINHGYMAPDAVELRNQRHERSLQQYVASNNVSSRDTVAIEQWLRREKRQRHRLSGAGRPV